MNSPYGILAKDLRATSVKISCFHYSAQPSVHHSVLQIPANSVAPNSDLNLLISVRLTFSNWVLTSMLPLESGHRWKAGINEEFTSWFIFFLEITVLCCYSMPRNSFPIGFVQFYSCSCQESKSDTSNFAMAGNRISRTLSIVFI